MEKKKKKEDNMFECSMSSPVTLQQDETNRLEMREL